MIVKQVAEYLQMEEHTLYKLARFGKIPSIKIVGQWRFKKDVIDKSIDEQSLKRKKSNKNLGIKETDNMANDILKKTSIFF